MKLKILLPFLFFISLTFAQTGTVSGVILDKEFNNEPLPFANITIKGSTQGASTDDQGRYSITLKPGNYTLMIAFLGYETKEIPFTLKAGEKKVINHTLEASGVQLEDIVLTHTVSKESEQALLQEQQKAVEIKQAIGAEEISKKGISDVAAAVAKTTGISKSESSSGIFVRGLGDRYNMTTLNGLPLPSNNPSTKNISLDLFSTDIVEYIGIDKTYNYKNYGDFAGANIDIVSKNYTGSGMLEVGTGFGVNSNAISQDKFYLQDGPNYYGFTNQSEPKNGLAGYNFKTSWDKHAETPVNTSYYLRGGDSFSVGDNGKFSFFINGSFDNSYTYKEGALRGSVTSDGTAKVDLFQKSYNYSTSTNGMLNLAYKINNKNTIKTNTLYINSSNQNHSEYTGILDIFDIAPNGGGYQRRSTFDRTSLLVNQLLGDHKLFNEKVDFNWGLSYNMMTNVIPDRMQNTFIPRNDDDLSQGLVPSNFNKAHNHRYYQEMTDDEVAGNFSASYKFKKDEDGKYRGKFTAGYSGRYKLIDFNAIQYNLQTANTAQPNIDINNIDAYYNQNNFDAGLFTLSTLFGDINSPNGYTPQSYSGQQIISAGYGAIDYQFTPKLFVNVAFRSEFIIQDIEYLTTLVPTTTKKFFDTMEYLPSLAAKYELTEKQNLKLAASKSYTLPQFKERAPFQYEEINQVYFGNPYLYNSTDYNFDLKWEYFPKNGEVISVTGFGKYIQNPINQTTVASAANDISYVNSGEKAVGFGAEFEFRKFLFNVENNSTNESTNLALGINLSYLHTNQDLDRNKVQRETKGTINAFFTETSSGLTGASDLLVNTDLSFNMNMKNDKALTMTATCGYFSDRIYALGTNYKGDIVDKAVLTTDFILKYKVNKNLGIGLSAKNLNDPKITRVQENKTVQDVTISEYRKGRNFGLSIKYEF
ncbi:MAG: carboxypeptidase-like regulatory domain-containing protein [Flavobacterium sp.]|nr:carboxypeptidase-like regulatory domain-containing protein [Flavobacterium sp.]